jgi:phosphoribosylformylglycinamidine (FGAM) synthase-like amidotransferase family enzyme
MSKKAFILYAPGTNCEVETMEALKLAGANPLLVFLADIISGKIEITDCDIFCIPGGFSYGDHVDTGIIVGILIRDFIPKLLEKKIPIIAICNGFQILMRSGTVFGNNVTLTRNASNVFCSRPILHKVEATNCIWTKGLDGKSLQFPSAHGGGRVIGTDINNVAMIYEGVSPNGGTIAALTNDSGIVFGIMDHPERPYGNPDGLLIFENCIKHVA